MALKPYNPTGGATNQPDTTPITYPSNPRPYSQTGAPIQTTTTPVVQGPVSLSKPGAAITFIIGGAPVAYATGINITEDDSVTDIDVIDQLQVAELAYITHKVSFSVNLIKIDANAAETVGLRPAYGSNLSSFLSNTKFTCEVFDSSTYSQASGSGSALYLMTGVVFTGGTGTVEARDIWRGTWNFRAQIGGGSI